MTARRSAPGESTVYQDAGGRWHGYVTVGKKPDGKRDRRHVRGGSRAEVVAKVRAHEQKRDQGTVLAAGQRPTVAQWLEHWLETIAARKVRPTTLLGYRSKVRLRIIPALGHHRLDRLQPEHLEAFYAELAADGLASGTVLQCHRILSRALKVAMQRGKVARNVCGLVDAPSLRRHEILPLSQQDARQLLITAAAQRNAARWSVALALGLRQGEALALSWDDVDLDAGTIRVRRALQRLPWQHGCPSPEQCGRASMCPERHSGGLSFTEPKSRAGRRTIALPDGLRESLRTHRSEQLEERLAAGSVWEDHGLVFAQVNGRPIDSSADWKAWKALLRTAGVRDARLHDARHTAATLLLLQGVSPRVAMQILGHSQIALTLGTYSHVVPELARDAAERIDDVLWGEMATTLATSQRASAGPAKRFRRSQAVGRVGLEPTTEGL